MAKNNNKSTVMSTKKKNRKLDLELQRESEQESQQPNEHQEWPKLTIRGTERENRGEVGQENGHTERRMELSEAEIGERRSISETLKDAIEITRVAKIF